MLLTISRAILDFCLPRECPACRIAHESISVFCTDCEQDIQKLNDAPRCDRCAMPVTLTDAPCAHCMGKGLPPFKQIVCLGVLKDALKASVHRAKYEHRWPLAERLADRLVLRSDVRSLLTNSDVIVPVPLHFKRQRQRGYNQADVIARQICRNNSKVKHAAVRALNTETQTHMPSRAKRMANLSDAFLLIDPDAIAGKNVVLIDDVLTTGSTLVSLARTLNVAKPASLSAIVIAVADPKGRQFEVI
jgi:ComF family protein